MLLAFATAFLLRRKSPLAPMQQIAIWIGGAAGAAFAAKIPFIIISGGSIFNIESWLVDGKTIMSGFAGGYFGIEITKWLLHITAKTGDGLAVPLAAAVGVGRLGCYFNGCCTAPGHPVPLYECAFHISMALLLWRLESVAALRWQLVKLYLIAYCIFRFLIEFIRVEPRVALGLTAYQFGAVAFAAILTILWRLDDRKKIKI